MRRGSAAPATHVHDPAPTSHAPGLSLRRHDVAGAPEVFQPHTIAAGTGAPGKKLVLRGFPGTEPDFPRKEEVRQLRLAQPVRRRLHSSQENGATHTHSRGYGSPESRDEPKKRHPSLRRGGRTGC